MTTNEVPEKHYDQYFLRYNSVQLRIPLRDPVELRGFVNMILLEMSALNSVLKTSTSEDRLGLLQAQARIVALNRKMNPSKAKISPTSKEPTQ